jgi:nitrite reductase/ring-hydroxylating ferredoxin subunit
MDHKDRPQPGTRLCALHDIPDQGGFEVAFGAGDDAFRILLLRQGEQCWSYRNQCPHFSLPLNFHPQTFVVMDAMVVCAHHTAFFNFSDGACVDGPCAGTGLTPLPSCLQDGSVYFGDASSPAALSQT